MPDIAKLLKEEISRLARKETRAAVSPLTKQIQSLKRTIRDQNERIKALNTTLATKADIEDSGVIKPVLAQEKVLVKPRTSPKSIKRQRQRLKLSQRQMGLLLGVSTLTINKWEMGNAKPRGKNLEAFALLRGMGLKEVRARLAEVEPPPKKRGRKPKKKA